MSSETKQKARTIGQRNAGLTKARAKNTLSGPDTPLKATTIVRLEAVQESYETGTADLNTTKNNKVAATAVKLSKAIVLTNTASHFLQVFMLGVIRAVFPNAALSFFNLDVVNPTLPPISTDADITNVSLTIIKGDASRMSGAGSPVAMAMPSAAQVATARAGFLTASDEKDIAAEAFKAASDVLAVLNTEADEVLNLVGAEVEAVTVNDTPGAARDIGRTWGFIYVKTGSPKRLTGTVINILTGELIEDADVELENGVNQDTTGPAGTYELNTTLMGVQPLLATHPHYTPFAENVTFVENENLEFTVKMTPL
jgi:hypothetical protein